MIATVVAVELHLPQVGSLKEKRRIVKSLKERIHHRFRVSIAETGFHDLHQRAELGIAAVSARASHLDELIASIRRLVDERMDVIVTRWDETPLEAGR